MPSCIEVHEPPRISAQGAAPHQQRMRTETFLLTRNHCLEIRGRGATATPSPPWFLCPLSPFENLVFEDDFDAVTTANASQLTLFPMNRASDVRGAVRLVWHADVGGSTGTQQWVRVSSTESPGQQKLATKTRAAKPAKRYVPRTSSSDACSLSCSSMESKCALLSHLPLCQNRPWL